MIWIMILIEIICILFLKKVSRVCVKKMNIDYISRGENPRLFFCIGLEASFAKCSFSWRRNGM